MNPIAGYLGDLSSHRHRILVLLGWSMLQALPVFVTGRLVAFAIDAGFLGGRPLLGVLVAVSIPLFALVGATAAHRVFRSLAEVVEPLRDSMIRRIVTAAITAASTGSGDTGASRSLARITRQTEAVRAVTAGILVETASLAVTIVAVAVGLFLLAEEVLALVLLPLAISLLLLFMTLGRLMRRQDGVYRAEEELAIEAEHGVKAFRDIVVHGRNAHTANVLSTLASRQAAAEVAVARAGTMRILVIAVGGHLPLILVLVFASLLSAEGMSPGELLGALTYVSTGLIPALRSFVGVMADSFPRLVTALRRVGASGPVHAPTPEPPTTAPVGSASCDPVMFESVTFSYGEGAPVFQGLDLTFDAGEHIVVVGPSGAGKSTLVDLLCGVRAPNTGRVLVGGRCAKESGRVAVLPQEGYVFDATLRENLGYLSCGPVDDERAARVIDALEASDLIDRMGGLDARVDPRALSPGERQLISLVRPALSGAGVIVLDEATSRLPPRKDRLVEGVLRAQGRTLIVVAHRLDTVRRADRVVVVGAAGVEVGTHEELLRVSPVYRDLLGLALPAPDH